MPTNLTGIGTITYNGFTFNGPRVSSEISIRPVRDAANRTVIYSLYTLTVEAYITADMSGVSGTGVDASTVVTPIEALLTKDGCALKYNGFGHGNLEVNTTSQNRDVNWGPKTQLLHFKPVGSIGCFEVVWTVEFALPECGVADPVDGVTSGIFQGVIGNFKSFNFGIEYGISANGCTRRTISGHYEIILHRIVSDPTSPSYTKIEKTADEYREDIAPSIPLFFRRESQSWRLSPDKSRMDFTIIDVEMESDNAFPPGIANMQMSHRAGSSRQAGAFAVITNTLSGSVEMAKPYTLAFGWEKVLLVMKERVSNARQVVQGKGYVFVDAVEVTEHIFGRGFEFSFTYRLLANPDDKTPLVNFWKNSGLFAPLQSTDFVSWGNSLAPIAWDQRGAAGLAFKASEDQIIDPCFQGTGTDQSDSQRRVGSFISNGSLTNTCPDKSRSYILWNNAVSLEWSGNTVVAPVAMPTSSANPFPTNTSANAGSAFPASGTATPNFSGQPTTLKDGTMMGSPPVKEMDNAKVQASPNANVWIVLRGGGLRLCYPCEIPQLATSIDGTPTVYSSNNSKVEQRLVGVLQGIKIYSATWELRYQLMANDLSALKDKDLDSLVMGTPDDQNGNKAK